ncbi:MAG TPA: hypothetical protein VIZ43_16850 [Trebonia sp.]
MATTRVVVRGPVFDGRADAAVHRFLAEAVDELAQIGQTWIRTEAEGFDRSGRGGTGRAAAGVEVRAEGSDRVIRGGISEGEYAWPWLEGTSRRNSDTSFRGYHTFRRTRLRMRKQAGQYAQDLLEKYLPQMGGH